MFSVNQPIDWLSSYCSCLVSSYYSHIVLLFFHWRRILIFFFYIITAVFVTNISACIHKAVNLKLKWCGWHSPAPVIDVFFLFFLSSVMQQVLDNLKDLPSGTGAKDIDLIFLRGIMESPIVRSLAKVTHTHTRWNIISWTSSSSYSWEEEQISLWAWGNQSVKSVTSPCLTLPDSCTKRGLTNLFQLICVWSGGKKS